MSSIFVSVGQCGNQLCKNLIDYLKSNQTTQTSYLFNNFDGKYHFVNLDSEIKVINRLLQENKENLRSENVINTRCGRGSNWASGYTGLKKDGSLKIIEQSLEAIRKESERCDFLLNFILMHSLSGGTGSGCGSRLIEELRNEFGWKKLIFTQSVAPFKDGELPLQHYNNLLCLSQLQEYADFIGLYQNDDVLNLIEKNRIPSNTPKTVASKTGLVPFNSAKLVKSSTPNIEDTNNSVSIEDMNGYIIKCLLNSISPVDSVSIKNQSIGMELFELQRFLCPNPSLKLVEFYNLNENSSNLLKKLLASIPKYKKNNYNESYTSLNSLIISRGSQELNEYNNQIILGQLVKEMDSIKKSLNPVLWNPFAIDFWSSKYSLTGNEMGNAQSKKLKTITSSLSVCTNRNKCVEYLSDVVDRARTKYSARAYLHWYEKFSIEQERFESSFENLKSIIDAYDQMTR